MVQELRETFPDAEIAGYTDAGWYFWDESQAHCFGPYATEDEALAEQDRYAREILGPA